MRKSVCRLLLLLGLSLVWNNPAMATTRWALLIGVNDYPKDVQTTTPAPSGQEKVSWPDLKYAVDDVRAMRDALMTVGYAAENIIVIDSNADDPLFRPTRQNIINRLQAWAANPQLGEDDSVMVVFTGHGFTEGGESLLCPSDIDVNKLKDSGIPVSWISELLASAKVAQRYLIVDACRNEISNIGLSQFNMLSGLQTLAFRQQGEAPRPEPATPQGIVYFASCLAGQRSVEDKSLGHGVFLHFFTVGLKGLADVQPGGDRNRQVSPYEAFKYAADETRRWTRRQFSWEQQPWVEGRSTNDLHLTEIPAGEHAKLVAEAATIETQIPSAFTLQAQFDLELAILALHEGDNKEATLRADEAIKFDPANTLARQTRAMLYLLETTQTTQLVDEDSDEVAVISTPNYARALQQMRAVNRPLMVRVSADVALLDGTKTAATAHQGDVLLASEILTFGTQQWLRIQGIQRKGKHDTETFQLLPVVSLAALSQSVNGYDQLQEFDSRNQQPGYLVRGGYGGAGNGGGGERAMTALRWVNFGLSFAGGGGFSVPVGPNGGGNGALQRIPYAGRFLGR